jgi:hypothetical protein
VFVPSPVRQLEGVRHAWRQAEFDAAFATGWTVFAFGIGN